MRIVLACAAALLAANGHQEPIELSFHPARGSRLEKSFEVESSGQLTALRFNGNDASAMLRDLDGLTVESKLRVTDEVLEVGRGRPLELVRDFDQVETEWGWHSRHEVLHPLLYRSVRFVWDPERAAYDKDWEPRRRSTAGLDGLWEDLDYRCLLPDEPVAVGESWYLSLRHIAPALLPGGTIQRGELLWDEWNLFELEDALAPRSRHWFRNDDVHCRLVEVLELDGRPHARVAIAWTWWGWLDLVDEGERAPWWVRFGTEGAVVELEMKGEGELLWDLDGGHFATFELEVECEAELELRSAWATIEVEAEGAAVWHAEARLDG